MSGFLSALTGVGSSASRDSKRRSKRKSTKYAPGVAILLDRAEGLPAADSNGKSDPYVVFRIGKLSKHKSGVIKKTLNPTWREEFFMACPEHTSFPLELEVRDKDTIGSDFLGSAVVDISAVDTDGQDHAFTVELFGRDGDPAGSVFLTVRRDTRKLDGLRDKESVQKWAIPTGDRKVVVELIEARDINAGDSNGYSDGYVVLKLNKVKHRSRTVTRSLNPKWRQRFEFPLPAGEPGVLKAKLWDKDSFSRDDPLGDFEMDLDVLQPKIVNESWLAVTHKGAPAGHVHLLVTVIDLDNLELTKEQRREMVGSVKLHIVQARGLSAADRNGKSDPYVEVSLGNARLRTPVVRKTLDPVWDSLMELPARDIFAVLKITVWDEDRGSKPDHLGSVSVPLQDIRNGQTEWFALKTPDLLKRGRGEVQIAMNLKYKVPAAYMGLVKARDIDYMERLPPFSFARLSNAINRLNMAGLAALEGLIFVNEIFSWERGVAASAAGILVWCAVCLLFRPFMLPLALLGWVVANRLGNYQGRDVIVDDNGLIVTAFDDRTESGGVDVGPRRVDRNGKPRRKLLKGFDSIALDDDAANEELDSESEEEGGNDDDAVSGSAPRSEGKKSKKKKKKPRVGLRESYRILMRVAREVQFQLEFVASTSERIKNVFNWSVPMITTLVGLALTLATVVMIFVPWNVLLMCVGLYRFAVKYFRKFLRPRKQFHRSFIEAIEFLKRSPSDIEKVKYQRLSTQDLGVKKSAKLVDDEDDDE